MTHFSGVGPIQVVVGQATYSNYPRQDGPPKLRLIQGGKA